MTSHAGGTRRTGLLVAIVLPVTFMSACQGAVTPPPSPSASPSSTLVLGQSSSSPQSTPQLSAGPCPQPETSPAGSRAARISGWLRTCGTVIVDAQNQPVRLLTMNAGSFGSGTGYPNSIEKQVTGCHGYLPPPPQAYKDISGWGFNSVRMPIAWADLEPKPPARHGGRLVHAYNMPYVSAVDRAIQEFRSRGIGVILDMHQVYWSPAFKNIGIYGGATLCQGGGMPAWLYKTSSSKSAIRTAILRFFANRDGVQQGYADAWKFFARRYANDPAVIGADMMNEPVTHHLFKPSSLHLTDFYDRLGAQIRSVNPHILLIFEDNNYLSDDPADFGVTDRPSLDNAVYSFHTYVDTWAAGLQQTRTFLRRAKAWNVPAWNGEWDMFRASSPNPTHTDWHQAVRQFMRYYRLNDIGWTIYAYQPGWFVTTAGHPKPGLLAAAQAGF